MSDTPNPYLVPYARLRSDGIKQTIKIKPDSNFHFSLFTPDGYLFQINNIEQYSPLPPYYGSQISALFSFKKVD